MRRYRFHFQPADGYLGDCMPFYWKGEYHIFYCKAPLRRDGIEDLIWSHIMSPNLLNWKEMPDAILPGKNTNDPDRDGCATGSVIHHKGMFYAFYTGMRKRGPDSWEQKICAARSRDLVTFEKMKRPMLSIDKSQYRIGWSDPHVFWNDRDKRFWMLINSKGRSGTWLKSGSIGLATSLNLVDWRIHSPFYSPHSSFFMEVPELFRFRGRWYLFYSEFAEYFQTHYRYSQSIHGPWSRPAGDDGIDGSEFYAAKTASDGTNRYAFGWIRRKKDERDCGQPLWGGTLGIPHELGPGMNGTLQARLPAIYRSLGGRKIVLQPKAVYGAMRVDGTSFDLSACGGGLASCLARQACFHFLCKAQLLKHTACFGILFRASKDFRRAYRISFDRNLGQIAAQLIFASMTGHYHQPLELAKRRHVNEGKRQHVLELFADRDVIEVFVDNILAMSFRAYGQCSETFGFFVEDGVVRFSDCEFNEL